jgi:hypothetical protein
MWAFRDPPPSSSDLNMLAIALPRRPPTWSLVRGWRRDSGGHALDNAERVLNALRWFREH